MHQDEQRERLHYRQVYLRTVQTCHLLTEESILVKVDILPDHSWHRVHDQDRTGALQAAASNPGNSNGAMAEMQLDFLLEACIET